MAADIGTENKKHGQILVSVCAVFALSFIVSATASLFMHTKMLMQTTARVSQVACGQAAQTITYGLSYGKEISNYSGIDILLGSSAALCPELKNIYLCDTDGIIWGSCIKMMNNTVMVDKNMLSPKAGNVSTRSNEKELHVLQALTVNDRIVGFIGAVTDIKTVVGQLGTKMIWEVGLLLMCGMGAVAVAYLLFMHTKTSRQMMFMLTAALCVFAACLLHLDTQRLLLDTGLAQQADVMVAAIDADAARLAEKGIDIGNTIGFNDYLAEKIEGQDTISAIKLENKLNGQQYTTNNTEKMTTAYSKEYRESQFFNISVGIAKEAYDRDRRYAITTWAAVLAVIEAVIMAVQYMIKKKTCR